MADKKTVPIFDPTGKVRDIPADQVDQALKAGGQRAVRMTDPKGTERWIRDADVDAATKAGGKVHPDQPEGALSRFASSFAEGSGLSGIADAVRHPIDTVANLPSAIVGEGKRSLGELRQAWNAKRPVEAADHTMYAIPGVGGSLKKADEQAKQGDIAGAAGTITGLGTAAIAAPLAGEAVSSIPFKRVPTAVGEAAERFKQATYPKNVTLTPHEVATNELIKGMTPDQQAVQRIKGASTELPDALQYARRNNMPINGKMDAAKALRGRAEEVQSHYDDYLLKPHSGKFQSVPENYNGKLSGNGRNQASLGQINDRVNEINSELKSNYRKKLNSQTTEANASDADLMDEKRQLTNILHKKLGDMNGLAPEDIANTRQRAGKLRSLAEEMELSSDKDTLSAGRHAAAGPVSRSGHAVMDAVGGGPEITGNRIIKNALDQFKPVEQVLPQPNPPAEVIPPERAPIWQGIQNEKPPVMEPIPDAEAVANQQKQLAEKADRARQLKAQQESDATAEQQRRLQEGAALREGGKAKVAEARGESAPSESDTPTHPAGKITAWDEETNLPIVKRGKVAESAGTEEKQVVKPEADRGVQEVDLPVKTETPTEPTPESHVFSPSQWKASNPEGDVEAAMKAAQDDGYEVQE